MQIIVVERVAELKKNKEEIEKRLNVSISLTGKKVTIDGAAVDEYEAAIVLDALSLGFSAKKALLLTDPDNTFRKIHIKNFTRRKDLDVVRARLIGTEGKTRKTLEVVADCDIIVGDSEVGIIGSAESIEKAITAITNLIKGSKQANVYRFLERMNTFGKQRKETSIFKKAENIDEDATSTED